MVCIRHRLMNHLQQKVGDVIFSILQVKLSIRRRVLCPWMSVSFSWCYFILTSEKKRRVFFQLFLLPFSNLAVFTCHVHNLDQACFCFSPCLSQVLVTLNFFPHGDLLVMDRYAILSWNIVVTLCTHFPIST